MSTGEVFDLKNIDGLEDAVIMLVGMMSSEYGDIMMACKEKEGKKFVKRIRCVKNEGRKYKHYSNLCMRKCLKLYKYGIHPLDERGSNTRDHTGRCIRRLKRIKFTFGFTGGFIYKLIKLGYYTGDTCVSTFKTDLIGFLDGAWYLEDMSDLIPALCRKNVRKEFDKVRTVSVKANARFKIIRENSMTFTSKNLTKLSMYYL